MSRKALKVLVELKFRAVSCPGVHLLAKDDICLSLCFMEQFCMSECVPAVFPLLFHEKMTFEKIFRHAVDPGDIAILLEYEMVRIELVQLIPPGGHTLASFEEDARSFLFPEPKLVPSFSGVEREVLMTRAPHFPGIAPRLEFSTKTTIIECSSDAQTNVYPSVSMRPAAKRNRKRSGRPRTASRLKRPESLERGGGLNTSRSQSLSPLRTRNTKHLARLSLDSTETSQSMLASWPGAGRSASPFRSAAFANSSSPLTRSSSTVRFSSSIYKNSVSSGLADRMSEGNISSSETPELSDFHHGPPDLSDLRQSYRQHASPHREWEEVHERVRGLLTTPKAVRRLHYGATVSEVDQVLARSCISPGPP